MFRLASQPNSENAMSPNVPTSTAFSKASILSSPRTFKRPCANSARCKAPLLSASRASKRLARSLGRSKSSISLWTCRSCTQASYSYVNLALCLYVSFLVGDGGALMLPDIPGPSCLDYQQEELFADLNLIRMPIIIVTWQLVGYVLLPISKSGQVMGSIWGWSCQIDGKHVETTNLTLLSLLLPPSMTEIVGCHPAAGSNTATDSFLLAPASSKKIQKIRTAPPIKHHLLVVGSEQNHPCLSESFGIARSCPHLLHPVAAFPLRSWTSLANWVQSFWPLRFFHPIRLEYQAPRPHLNPTPFGFQPLPKFPNFRNGKEWTLYLKSSTTTSQKCRISMDILVNGAWILVFNGKIPIFRATPRLFTSSRVRRATLIDSRSCCSLVLASFSRAAWHSKGIMRVYAN